MAYATIDRHTNEMQQAIQNCLDCHAICLNTLTHLLKFPRHVQPAMLLLDCAEACQLAADYMLRGSDDFASAADFCQGICQRTATACEAVADDPHLRTCADICHRCAATCREMAQPAAT